MTQHRLVFVFIFSILGTWIMGSCDTANNIDDPDTRTFIKYYGSDGDQAGVDMLMLADGSAILLGNTRTPTTKRVYFVRIDSMGNVQEERVLGGTTDVAIDIEPTLDGNFVILSRVEQSADDHDFKLTIVDADGIKIDSVVRGFLGKKDNPLTVTPLSDGGFIVAGSTQYDPSPDFNPADPDSYANITHWRCDASFNFSIPNWRVLYGDPEEYDAAIKVFETSSGFYVFGYSTRPHLQNLVGKLNLQYYSISAGGDPSENVGNFGDFTEDTRLNFVLKEPPSFGAGYFQIGTRTNNSGTVTLHVVKTRSNLSFSSQDRLLDEEVEFIPRPLEGVSAAVALNSAPQGYLLLAEELRNLGTKNISLTKIDQSGVLLWSVSLGSEEENDEAAAVAELPNGKILVLGTVEIGDNQTKMALFKLNSTGRLHE